MSTDGPLRGPDPPPNEGGSGKTRNRHSLSDQRLLERALNQGWPVTEAMKELAMQRAKETLEDSKAHPRAIAAATRALLTADRLSDYRFLANFFRFYLHAAALNLLVRLRRAVVLPPPTAEGLGLPAELPTAAIDEPHRKKFFNRRRQRDPLGEGFACTWRTRLIKVAAEVITRTRRVIVRLSSSWPHLGYFLALSTPRPATPSG